MVLVDRLGHRQALEFRPEVDRLPLVAHRRRADDLLRDRAEQFLGQIHQVAVIAVRLVELEHRELGIVARRDAFVAEVAVDLEHVLQPPDHQPLQVQLRRDAKVELGVERVVVRDEGPRSGTARDRMHHRRLDFEVAADDEEFADRLDDLRALDENLARSGVGDQVEVALAVALLLVGDAVEFLGQRAQCLGEQAHAVAAHRQLARPGLEQHAGRADDVAEVPVLESRRRASPIASSVT